MATSLPWMPCCITCGVSWMRVSLDELGDLTRRLFLKLDYPIEQTEIIVSILAYAHCRGNFQSLIQEVAFGTPRFQARREIVVEKETALSCMIDAGGNIGMCAMQLGNRSAGRESEKYRACDRWHSEQQPAGNRTRRLLCGESRA